LISKLIWNSKFPAGSFGERQCFDADRSHFGFLPSRARLTPMPFGDVQPLPASAGIANKYFLFHGVTAGSTSTWGSIDASLANP
jgi:hypothetical protein